MNRQKLIPLVFIYLLKMNLGMAQPVEKQLSIPNYLKALDANPAVIISLQSPPIKTDYSPSAGERGHYRRIANSEVFCNSSVIFDVVSQYIKEDLVSFGIKPSIIINSRKVREEATTEIDIENSLRKKLYDAKSKYYIHVVLSTYPTEKVIEKGKSDRMKLFGALIVMYKNNGGSILFPDYDDVVYRANHMYYFKCIAQVKDAIASKPSNFFVKYCASKDTAVVPFRPLIETTEFPADLKQYEVLVIKYAGELEEFTNRKMQKALLNYPYKTKFVSYADVASFSKKQYKYVIEPRYVPYEHLQTTYKENSISEHLPTKSTAIIRTEYSYLVKNRETNTIYSSEKVGAVDCYSNIMPSKALNHLVNGIRKDLKLPVIED